VITIPSNMIVEAASDAGAVVNFATSAMDAVSGSLATTSSPASGSIFPLGTTTVTVAASDAAGNNAIQTFTITVGDTTAPVITVPSNLIVEATSAAGAVVNFSSSATDTVSGSLATTSSPVSGSTFPLGTTTVTVNASDAAGNNANKTFTITVRDTTTPVITVPSNMTVEATSAAGAVVSFSSSATDAVSGSLATTCSPESGSIFPLGTTTVTVNASDAAGNNAVQTFAIIVRDTTSPTITVPSNLTVEATSSAGAVVNFSTSAVDAVSGPCPTINTPASGSTFPPGTTTVTFNASDAAGNPASQTFVITITDPPPADGFAQWEAEQFTTSELADPAISGPNASPAGDGLSNLLKYALGLPAKTPSTTGITLTKSNETWHFTYRRPANRPDIAFDVEIASDPRSGSWTTAGVTHQRLSTGELETWQATCAPVAGGSCLFFRLHVSQP